MNEKCIFKCLFLKYFLKLDEVFVLIDLKVEIVVNEILLIWGLLMGLFKY